MTSQERMVADIVAGLVEGGVKTVVLSPGYRNAPLSLACMRCPGLEAISIIDERTAGFVALGIARKSGQPVAVCCTSGSALAHYLPAVIEARAAGLPLVVVSADRPLELHRVGAPQAIEQRGVFSDHVVYGDALETPASLDDDVPPSSRPIATRVAIALSHASRGPVHLNVALRKPLVAPPMTPPSAPRRGAMRTLETRAAIPSAAMATLRPVLAAAKRPLIVAGPTPLGTSPGVRRLAETTGWPVLADALSGLMPGEHVHRGLAPALVSEALRAEFKPDLVVWTGGFVTSTPVMQWLRQGVPLVLVGTSETLVDPTHQAMFRVPVTPETLAAQLEPLDPPSPRWRSRWQSVARRARAIVEPSLHRWWDGAVVHHALRSARPRWRHVASSLAVRDVDALCPDAVGLTSNRGANGIDGTIATAWGQALVEAPGLVVVGDVAFAHDVGSWTQLPRSLDLTVVVVDNAGGRIFEMLPIREDPDFEAVFVTPPRLDPVALALACGIEGTRVDDHESLARALDGGGAGPRLIHAKVDPLQSRQIREELRRAAQSLGAP